MSMYMVMLTAILNLFLESTLLDRVEIFGVVPNFSLILLVTIALSRGKMTGGFVGLVVGLLEDIIFSPIIGVKAFIYFFIGYTVGMSENKLSRDNLLIPVLMTCAATVFYNTAFLILMYFLSGVSHFDSSLGRTLILETLYNAILIVPTYKILSKRYILKGMSFGERQR